MIGRIAIVGLFAVAVLAGGILWFLQKFVEYQRFEGPVDGFGSVITLPETNQTIALGGIVGISGSSSPLKFRACFQAELSQWPSANLSYDNPTPLIAPDWFDCFDAKQLGADLEAGEARAFLVTPNIAEGVDLVVAFYADGRGFAWRQVN